VLLAVVVAAIYPPAFWLIGSSLGLALVAAVAAALAGLFDAHASATSSLSLAASGALPPADVRVPVLVAFSSNTCSKLVAAFTAGGVRYGIRVGAGLLAIAVALWIPVLWIR
jgi:uncharacterized membrane protein (DUF4010 family)